MTLADNIHNLPDGELVYLALSQASGFAEIDVAETLSAQLPDISTRYYNAEVDYAAEQKQIVNEARDKLDKLRKEIAKLKAALEKAQKNYDATKSNAAIAQRNLEKANDIITKWEPLELREVMETYAREVFGKGTITVVPGALIGPVNHSYWTYEEAHGIVRNQREDSDSEPEEDEDA